jgi:hypothetical protein
MARKSAIAEEIVGTPHYEVIAAGRKRVTAVAQPSLEPDPFIEYEFGLGVLLPDGPHGLLVWRDSVLVDHVGHFSLLSVRAARQPRRAESHLR